MPVEHYENFPVASILLPARLRRPVELVYRFAREADDFADEGDRTPEERLALLATFSRELDRISAGAPTEIPWFAELAAMIHARSLPLQPFRDLLSAFAQDVTKARYADFDDVLDYCSRSANPVGRILLYLYGAATEQNLRYGDAICTSLQLINFLQDVAIDWRKDRIYLSAADMAQFDITEAQISAGDTAGRWQEFMDFKVRQARDLMTFGTPLGRILRGRIGLEMRLIIAGGNRILDKIVAVRGDVFRHRPVLQRPDWLRMMVHAL